MNTKISKSQIEVWEWKNSLFEEIKNIPKLERLQYLRKKVSSTVSRIKLKKTTSV